MKKLLSFTLLATVLMIACQSATPNQERPEATEIKPDSMSEEKKAMTNFYPKLQETIKKLEAESQNIQEGHKAALDKIAAYIRDKQQKKEKCELVFICTHNSRRSHLAQIWAQTAAIHYGLENIVTYSGGTEATAFNPRAVAAIERAGFKVEKPDDSKNPHYKVLFLDNAASMECFSKKYSDSPNPQKGFMAVMVCDNADEACPVVAGAEARVALPFIDPKKSDGKPEESATYDERSMQIGAEMFYLMGKAKM
jgi:arsenate reductase